MILVGLTLKITSNKKAKFLQFSFFYDVWFKNNFIR